MTRVCPQCGTSFTASPARRKVCCSQSCAMKRRGIGGANNPRYNGGLCFHRGRWLVCCIDGTTMQFARAVMEGELRRPLRSDEIVHHINCDSSDDRVQNLAVVTRAQHINVHRDELLAGRRRKAVAA